MKKLNKASFSILAGLMAAMSVATQPVMASDLDRLALTLCESAKTDDRRTMRKKLGTAKIRLNKIYKAVRCGSEGSLLRVATNSGSMNAAKYIATKIRKADLSGAEDDGVTIIEYTQKLVDGGDASKQAFVDLFKSKI